jgi:hypothetical protein
MNTGGPRPRYAPTFPKNIWTVPKEKIAVHNNAEHHRGKMSGEGGFRGGSACVCIRQEVERTLCGQIIFVDGQVMTGNDDMHAGKQRALDVCSCSASIGVIQRLRHSIAVGGLKSFDDAKSLNPVEEAVLRDRLYELLVRHGGPSAARKRSWFVPHLWYARHPNWRHSNYYCLGPRPPAISHPYGSLRENARTYATRDEYLSAVAK